MAYFHDDLPNCEMNLMICQLRKLLQVNVEGRTGGARICVPAWNAVVTAKSEKAGPGL